MRRCWRSIPAGSTRPPPTVPTGGCAPPPGSALPIINPDVKPVFFHPDYPSGSQPIDYAVAGTPPCFLGAPRTDALVDPARNTGQMADKLRRAGVAAEGHWYDDVGHMTLIGAFAGPLTWKASIRDDVIAFIHRQARRL